VNKEKIITISIGLAVGIVVAVGYFAIIHFLPLFKKTGDQIVVHPKTTNTATSSPTVAAAQSIQLSLDQPADHSSTSGADIAISGQTVPGASIIIFSNSDEKIASTDAKGNFSGDIKLEEGENEISVTSFLDQENSAIVHRNVTLEINP